MLPPSSGLRVSQASNNEANRKEAVGKIITGNTESLSRKLIHFKTS
jgi:hypothetical protein